MKGCDTQLPHMGLQVAWRGFWVDPLEECPCPKVSILIGLVLYSSCAGNRSCWVHVRKSHLIFRRRWFTALLPTLWPLYSFTHSSVTFSKPLEGSNHSSLGRWLLAGCPRPSGFPTLLCIRAPPIGLSRLKINKIKTIRKK